MSQIVDPFARQVVPSNALDQLQLLGTDTRILKRAVVQASDRFGRTLKSRVTADPQYQLELQFSTDSGESFTPSPEILSARIYQVRLSLQQLQGWPLVQGFRLRWLKPRGWSWTDGIGEYTYEEAISNPLVVTRTCRSPNNVAAAAFRVIVVEELPLW